MPKTPTLEYGALNRPVLDAIPTSVRRVLDLGCGTGSLGRALKARQMVDVTGVTYSSTEAEMARRYLDRVIVTDLNTFSPTDLGRFDCIICSHILEHLYWPDHVLRAMVPLLEPGGRLFVALPNSLVWRQRVRFLRGEFRYTDGGLMDRTHFRFFDWTSARARSPVQDFGRFQRMPTGDSHWPATYRVPDDCSATPPFGWHRAYSVGSS